MPKITGWTRHDPPHPELPEGSIVGWTHDSTEELVYIEYVEGDGYYVIREDDQEYDVGFESTRAEAYRYTVDWLNERPEGADS